MKVQITYEEADLEALVRADLSHRFPSLIVERYHLDQHYGLGVKAITDLVEPPLPEEPPATGAIEDEVVTMADVPGMPDDPTR